jgi:5'-nucleotidase
MRLQRTPLDRATIFNVNVPDVPYEQLKGTQVTRLGLRHRSEKVVRTHDPKGKEVFWVGPAGSEQDAGPGTDFHAVANNYVSITPLQTDLTRHTMLDDLRDWISGRA